MAVYHLYTTDNDKNQDNQHFYFLEHVTFPLCWEPLDTAIFLNDLVYSSFLYLVFI